MWTVLLRVDKTLFQGIIHIFICPYPIYTNLKIRVIISTFIKSQVKKFKSKFNVSWCKLYKSIFTIYDLG